MAEDMQTGLGDTEDFDVLLQEQARLDAIKEKLTKYLTVMFTDVKGSTVLAETEGDMVSRKLIKEYVDFVIEAIQTNNGVFVKSIGDGTLSFFENANDALNAAISIQKAMDTLNMTSTLNMPLLVRIGIHSGKCIIDKKDIFGDTVNTAARFESIATPGDIYISEETYGSVVNNEEFYCRFMKEVTLKGKKDPFKAYKVFWNPSEIEHDKLQAYTHETQPKPTSKLTLALIVGIPFIIILLISLWQPIKHRVMETPSREIEHSISDN